MVGINRYGQSDSAAPGNGVVGEVEIGDVASAARRHSDRNANGAHLGEAPLENVPIHFDPLPGLPFERLAMTIEQAIRQGPSGHLGCWRIEYIAGDGVVATKLKRPAPVVKVQRNPSSANEVIVEREWSGTDAGEGR